MKRQNIINENIIRLGLFDKRFKIFDETKNVLLKVRQDARIDNDELHSFIKNSEYESKFLFDENISYLLREIFTKSLEINAVYYKGKNTINLPGSPEREL